MSTIQPEKKKYTLKKNEKLKSRSTIQSLFLLNKHLKLYPFKLVYKTNEAEQTKIEFGVTVSKRNFKTAVMRNLLKRRMREAYRLNKYLILDKIKQHNISLPIMLIYMGREPHTYQEMEPKIKQLLLRLADKINKDST